MQNMVASISPPEWELRKQRILSLYIEQDYPLRIVRKILAEEGFKASESQYRTRFKAWDVRKIKKNPPGETRSGKDATVADAMHPIRNQSCARMWLSDFEALYSNDDANLPVRPSESSKKESATPRQSRDPLGLASSNDPWERLPTDNPHTEDVRTWPTTSHADGAPVPEFGRQECNVISSMEPVSNDFWMEQMAGTQLEFDAAPESALLSGDDMHAAVMHQMADPLWLSETSF